MQSITKVGNVVAAWLLAATMAMTMACVEKTAPQEEQGTLAIPLLATGSDGATYQLNHAIFDITGPNGFDLTVDGSNQPSLTLGLNPGLYTVHLQPGWTLAKSEMGVFRPVQALLGSQNPQLVRVLVNYAATMSFQFLMRSPFGDLTITFGVDASPRQLTGGMAIGSGAANGILAPYSRAQMDFSFYLSPGAPERIIEADGTRRLQFTSDLSAAEFFNDPVGLLADYFAPRLNGQRIEFHLSAHPDGTQEFGGSYNGYTDDSSFELTMVNTSIAPLSLDAEGFPIDQFFHEVVPFNLSVVDGEYNEGSASGRLVLRNLPN